MVGSALWHEKTREQLNQAAADTLLILPLGATEQHGPHLATGTDFLIVEHLARSAAAEVGQQIPVLVAPTLPFGSSHHHLPFGGTISISTTTYYALLCELLESIHSSGFTKIFMLNGHGGNDDIIKLAARDTALKLAVNIAAASYWTIAWDALVADGVHLDGELPGHAGNFETSIMLALHAGLVSEQRLHREDSSTADPRSFYPPYKKEIHGFWQSFDGYTDSPDHAKFEAGDRYLQRIVGEVTAALIEFYSVSS